MKPWKCRQCHEWNAGQSKRCETCNAGRVFVGTGIDAERAARAAAVCEAVPGLAAVFAEIARAMRSYAAHNGLEVAMLDPSTIVSPTGKVVVDLSAVA